MSRSATTSISLTPEAKTAIDELRAELAERGTARLPTALKPNGALTVSEMVLLGVRAVRHAMR